MKRTISLLLLTMSVMFGVTAYASPITSQQAQQNALEFLKKKGKTIDKSVLRDVSSKGATTQSYYVFNIGNNDGYVIAAGDDQVPAILGYSDHGTVLIESMPANLKAWLENYDQQIQYIQKNSITSNTIIKGVHAAISPLMTTTWNQSDPYNQSCPDFFTYGKSVTGCVATAMAQIMYYHRNRSVNQTLATIPAYTCATNWNSDSGTQQIQVSSIPAGSVIDWDNMLNSYSGSATATQKKAVADLMFYCGASVSMDYANSSNGGSGAYSEDVPDALKTYFGYSDNMQLVSRDNYTNDNWDNLIYNELTNHRPVFYSGRTSANGGHAFVCDGYDGNGYYHINWGWGGYCDTYFLLSDLTPEDQGIGGSEGGFNNNQRALIGAEPSGNTPPPVQQYTLSVSAANSGEIHLYDRNGNDISGTSVFDAGSYIRIEPQIPAAMYIKEILVNDVSIGTWNDADVQSGNSPHDYTIESLSGNMQIEFRTYLYPQYRTLTSVAKGPGSVMMYKNGNYIGTTTNNGSGNVISNVFDAGDILKLVFVPEEGCQLTQLIGSEHGSEYGTDADYTNQVSDNTFTIAFDDLSIGGDPIQRIKVFEATFEGKLNYTINFSWSEESEIKTGEVLCLDENGDFLFYPSDGHETFTYEAGKYVLITFQDHGSSALSYFYDITINGVSIGGYKGSDLELAGFGHSYSYEINSLNSDINVVITGKRLPVPVGVLAKGPGSVHLYRNGSFVSSISGSDEDGSWFGSDFYKDDALKLHFIPNEGCRLQKVLNGYGNNASFDNESEMDDITSLVQNNTCTSVMSFGPEGYIVYFEEIPPAQQYTISVNSADTHLHIYDRNGNDITDDVHNGVKFDAGSYFHFVLEIGDAYYISEIKVNGVSVGQWGEENKHYDYEIESLSSDMTIEFSFDVPIKYKTVYCKADGPGSVKMYKNGAYVGTTTNDGYGYHLVSVVIDPTGGDEIKLEFIPEDGCKLYRLGHGFYDVDTETNDISNEISNNIYTIKYSSDDVYADNRMFAACFERIESSVILNETNFPDPTFRAYVSNLTRVAEGGIISDVKLQAVKKINVSGSYDTIGNITSLQGIEFFTALTSLNCNFNQLTSLDVSNNTALIELNCYGNQLTSLDVSNNTALTELECGNNQLTILDVSNNTALTSLYCSINQLTSLDVSNNTALTSLDCNNNQLTSLDMSNNTALSSLHCFNNQLTSLDVSDNTALTDLWCSGNQLTSLNVSNCTALISLGCSNNQLTSLDVSGCTALTSLSCDRNQLTSLDVSNNTALTSLNCNYNQFTSLDVTNKTALISLNCSYNHQLKSLDVSNNVALSSLHCINKQLTSLDVSGCTALTSLYCDNYLLTNLNVSNCTALTLLSCHGNQLTSLDVSGCTALTDLWCYNNQLTSLNVSNNLKLTSLSCEHNQLTSLDLSNNVALTSLYCGDNQLTSLDVSNNVALISLGCGNNQLTNLDVSNNVALTSLGCALNQLTSLDVSNNTALTYINCSRNKLISLDISNNTALGILVLGYNQLTNLDVSNNTSLTELACVEEIVAASIGSNQFSIPLPSGFDLLKVSEFKVNDISTTPSVVAGTLVFTSSSIPQTITYQYDQANSVVAKINVYIYITAIEEGNYDNTIYMDNMEVISGTEAVLSVKMKNTVVAEGFGFDMYLPDGITVLQDEDGFPEVTLSTERTTSRKTNSFDAVFNADGSLRVLAASTNGSTISGNDGEIVQVKVAIADDMVEGDYTACIKNIAISDENATSYTSPMTTSTITVNAYIIGDANIDKKVDVADFTAVAHHLLENTPANFHPKAADANQDERLDVADLTAIAHLILYGTISKPTNASPAKQFMPMAVRGSNESMEENYIYIEPVSVQGQSQVTLSIKMRNTVEAEGFGFDLYLPEGMTFATDADGFVEACLSMERTDPRKTNSFDAVIRPDGALRVLAASTNGSSISGNDGEIVLVTINIASGMEVGEYPLIMKEIAISDVDAVSHRTDLQESTITILNNGISTNINGMDNLDNNAEWYTLDGKKLNGKPKAKGVYIMNRKKVRIK